MKIAVLGVGFLGSKLLKILSNEFEMVGASKNSRASIVQEIDATDKNRIKDFLNFEKPDIVIDTIALSSYFLCEKNPTLCKKLNYDTAKNIANICKNINAKMIFISSSYVFDGEKGNYTEFDIPNSKTKYAISKILAEKQILKLKNSIIIRAELL